MLYNHGVTAIHLCAPCHLAFIDCSSIRSVDGLQIDAFIIDGYMFMNRVLVFAEVAADKSLLYWPWQSSLVGFEAASDKFLFFGQGRGSTHLFRNQFFDFLVECIHFLLLLFLFGEQVLLFCLQRLQHVFLLALIACQFVLFAFL